MKNEPAFPHEDIEYDGGDQYKVIRNGLTKLEYALIHGHYEPSKSDIDTQVTRDRLANPHNDSYKPRLRSYNEIVNGLKISYYKELLTQLSNEKE